MISILHTVQLSQLQDKSNNSAMKTVPESSVLLTRKPCITFICTADCRLPKFGSKQAHKSSVISSEGCWSNFHFGIDVPLHKLQAVH